MVMVICVASVFALAVVAMWIERMSLPKADPEKLLMHRFAKGEIDEADYARRLAVLRYGPPLEIPD